MIRLTRSALFVLLVVTSAAVADVKITVEAGDVDRVNSPVTVTLSGEGASTLAKAKAAVLTPGDIVADVQATDGGAVLRFVLPELKAGATATYTAKAAKVDDGYSFKDIEDGLHRDLLYMGKPVWRYAYLKHDPANHVETFKHFHHVYGFHDDGFITNGPPYGDAKIQFPHHRGLFIGWRSTKAGGKSYDTWHCTNGVADKFVKFIDDACYAGHTSARSVSVAEWGDDAKNVVRETRDVVTWNVGEGKTLMDFTFKLEAIDDDVELDGDPQHAGFQFRAFMGAKAEYIRPASASGGNGDVWKDTIWCVNQFKKGDHAYAVEHMDHPENPGTKEGKTVYSTRSYGRFGAFAKHSLKKDAPLVFHYRVLIVDADKTKVDASWAEARHADFVTPVKATVSN
ncbi:MAG: hypothetical protein GC159_13220 [Phycisphaera sp.]|nr:hypothetical protein [Phycisphaera sp.]